MDFLEEIKKLFAKGILTNNQLKVLALICMTIDHIGKYLLPDKLILRIIGRSAFPIFAYMTAEGCKYTSNRKKYFARIAVITALYLLAGYAVTKSLVQCGLVTLALSVVLVYTIDCAENQKTRQSCIFAFLMFISVFVITAVLPELITGFSVDYGFFGVMIPVLVYQAESRPSKLLAATVGTLMLAAASGGIQWFSVLALLPLSVYNKRRGERNLKYLFYVYYPVHVGVLYILGMILNKGIQVGMR